MKRTETDLAVIPAAGENDRLLVVLCHTPGQGSEIELRQQSWGDGLGWYTQSSVRLEPCQVANLRGALGGSHRSSAAPPPLPAAFSQLSQVGWQPRVVCADSA